MCRAKFYAPLAPQVLHYDPNDPEQWEVCVGFLDESDCFGERALCESRPHAMSLRAHGTLYVAYISREDFEEALGDAAAADEVERELVADEAEREEREMAASASLTASLVTNKSANEAAGKRGSFFDEPRASDRQRGPRVFTSEQSEDGETKDKRNSLQHKLVPQNTMKVLQDDAAVLKKMGATETGDAEQDRELQQIL
jgi:hypothetical protein